MERSLTSDRRIAPTGSLVRKGAGARIIPNVTAGGRREGSDISRYPETNPAGRAIKPYWPVRGDWEAGAGLQKSYDYVVEGAEFPRDDTGPIPGGPTSHPAGRVARRPLIARAGPLYPGNMMRICPNSATRTQRYRDRYGNY